MKPLLLLLLASALAGPAAAQDGGDVPPPRPRPAAPVAATPDAPTPQRDYQVACPAVLSGRAVATALPPIAEGQCGLPSPLALEAVLANGRTVPLSTPVTTDCGMATALPGWVEAVDAWLMAREDTRIDTVLVGTAYLCRNVNNADAGNLSFHAFGDALDVTGFRLADGRTITIESAWPGDAAAGSRLVRFAHEAACTHFTTVLGPEANALHRDHLHLDLGCHGERCMARICE
jgi:hypothetical protein